MARKRSSTTGTITVDLANSNLVFGGKVAYTYTLSPTPVYPDARAVITQNGVVVQNDFVSVHPQGFPNPINLGPTPMWSGGAASGVLELGFHTSDTPWIVVATSAPFSVGA